MENSQVNESSAMLTGKTVTQSKCIDNLNLLGICDLDINFGANTSSVYENMRVKDLNDEFEIVDNSYLSYRKIVVDWMLQIADFFHVDISTGHMSVSMMDRLSPDSRFSRSEWQLIAICCLRLAAKYCEREEDVPCLSRMEKIAQERLSHSEILQFEIYIMSRLGWRLDIHTHSHFLSLYYNKVPFATQQDEFSATSAFFDQAALTCSVLNATDADSVDGKRRKHDKQQVNSRKKSRLDQQVMPFNLESCRQFCSQETDPSNTITAEPSIVFSKLSGLESKLMDIKLKSISLIISRMCIREFVFKSFPSSISATAIYCMARLVGGAKNAMSVGLSEMTRFSLDQVFPCMLLIDRIISTTCKKMNQNYVTAFQEAMKYDLFDISRADLIVNQQLIVVDAVKLPMLEGSDDETLSTVHVLPYLCEACASSNKSTPRSPVAASMKLKRKQKELLPMNQDDNNNNMKKTTSSARKTTRPNDLFAVQVNRSMEAIGRLEQALKVQCAESSHFRVLIESACYECGQLSPRIKRIASFLNVSLASSVGFIAAPTMDATNDTSMDSCASAPSDSSLSILSCLSASILDSYAVADTDYECYTTSGKKTEVVNVDEAQEEEEAAESHKVIDVAAAKVLVFDDTLRTGKEDCAVVAETSVVSVENDEDSMFLVVNDMIRGFMDVN